MIYNNYRYKCISDFSLIERHSSSAEYEFELIVYKQRLDCDASSKYLILVSLLDWPLFLDADSGPIDVFSQQWKQFLSSIDFFHDVEVVPGFPDADRHLALECLLIASWSCHVIGTLIVLLV